MHIDLGNQGIGPEKFGGVNGGAKHHPLMSDRLAPPGMSELLKKVQHGFSNYVIERELGSGGMATVYLAHDRKHDRKVAIKVLHAELAAMLGTERFLGEIKVTAHLQHPHILGLIDSGTIGEEGDELRGRPYYVMPYIEGESLRERLERDGQLPVPEAVRIATEVASALDYAHRHGVIHRDIKPGNILLYDGTAVVADFGISLAISEAGGTRITQSGIAVGTPAYMSPEQAAADRTVSARTDIYALGAVTYEMLSGETPFTGPSVQAIIARVLMEEPRLLTTRRRSIPPHVEAAVLKALEKLPADRFASAHEFAEALTGHSIGIPVTPPRVSVWRDRSRYQTMFYGASAAALLFLGFAAWGWLRPKPREPVTRYALVFDSTESIAPLGDYDTRLAISPDGSHLVYLGANGRFLIRARNALHAVVAPGTEGGATPFFSPDGKYVGGMIDGRGMLIAPVYGGPAFTIANAMLGTAGASWGPDGFIYVDARASSLGGGLLRTAPKPGAPTTAFTTLDTASGEIDHTWPEVLPNGKGVIFTVQFNPTKAAQRRSVSSIAVADIHSGNHRVLLDGAIHAVYSASGHLLYVTTKKVLMVVPFDQNSMKITGEPVALVDGMRSGSYGSTDLAISRNGTLVYGTGGSDRELVWVSRDGKLQPVDPDWRASMQDPEISPDGKRLAVTLTDAEGATSVWVKQLDRGPSLDISLDARTNVNPTWTPDGRSITFVSDFDGPLQIWTKSAYGTGQAKRELLEQRDLHGPEWSRDGRWLVGFTDFNTPGASDIIGFRPGIDHSAISLIATRSIETTPQISPDGRWLAYTSSETGVNQVYVTPFPNITSAKWPVSTRGGMLPRWAHSGRELFFVDTVGLLNAAEINTRSGFSVGRTTALFQTEAFWLDNSGPGVPQYAVSPDDSRFIMLRPINKTAPDRVVVVDNWCYVCVGKRWAVVESYE